MSRARLLVPVAGALLLLALVGCGNERKLTAEEFIDEMNSHGAQLRLGAVIAENPDGADVNEVTLIGTAPTATGEGGKPVASGSGTLLVVADADTASEEFDRCEGAPALTCFRAANVVLRVEDLQPTDQARLTTATEALAADGG